MKIHTPLLPTAFNQPVDLDDFFKGEDSVTEVHVKDMVFSSSDLGAKSIEQSLFETSDFSGVEAPRFYISDTMLKNCNFTVTKFPESSWMRVAIKSGRCSGLDISNSTLRHVEFTNSKLEFVNFRFSKLENVAFENCVLNDVDFYDAKLKNVQFINCTIQSITFAQSKMDNVDVSQSTIERINGVSSIKGVIISHDQLLELAPYFAAEAGIKIK
ncbi:pentapeptide repeat-containing protein [soil metagenome]